MVVMTAVLLEVRVLGMGVGLFLTLLVGVLAVFVCVVTSRTGHLG